MSDTKLCISCMLSTPATADHCPHCGFNGSQQNAEYALPIGTRLNERYVLGKAIACDGEVISYVGYDISGQRRVEIKEYAPLNGSYREDSNVLAVEGAEIHFKNGLSDFCDLYAGLERASAKQSALIEVYETVKIGNTAYAVCEYFDGSPLDVFLGAKTEPVSYKQALLVFAPVFDALSAIHAEKLVHRGVSPHTILVRRDGAVKLSGYATAAVRTKGTEYPAALFDGYSAPEQYTPNSFIGPAADVYALAACIYYAFTAITPADAQKRRLLDSLEGLSGLRGDLPDCALKAVNAGLILEPKKRAADVAGFSAIFRNVKGSSRTAKSVSNVVSKSSEPDSETDGTDSLMAKLKIAAGVAAGLLVVCAIVFFSWELYKAKLNEAEPVVPVEPTALVVPNLVGKNIFNDAIAYDKNYKYELAFYFSSSTEKDIVISTTPNAGSALESGGTVVVNVSKGVQVVKIPKVTGLTALNAGAALEAAGVIDYGVQVGSSSTAIPGTVYSQSVAPGTDFYPGSEVIILMVAPLPAAAQADEGIGDIVTPD